MAYDLRAVVHAYGSRAVEYAEEFGNDLSEIDFDRAVVERALVGLRRPARVLDIGCGPGQISAFVEARGDLAVAMDMTFEMLIVARRRQAARAFTCADVRWIPCAENSFAAAFCWYSLHHLPRLALPAVLEEMRRVMCPGGRLAIGTHGGEGERWHDTEWDGQSERVLVTHYAADELSALVFGAGFSNVAVTTRPPLPHEHQAEKVYVEATVT